MAIHRVPNMDCLACGSALNHVGDQQTPPNPGDFTICLYCKNIMAFRDDLSLRPLTPQEMEECKTDEGVQEAKDFAEFYAKVTGKAVRH